MAYCIKQIYKQSIHSVEAYVDLLYELVICGTVPRIYITALSESNMIYNLLRQGVNLKHIREKELIQKVNSKPRKTNYYHITADGLQYLTENYFYLSVDKQWVQYLNIEKGTKIKTEFPDAHVDRIARYLNVCGCKYVFNSLSAKSNLANCSIYYENSLIISSPTNFSANVLNDIPAGVVKTQSENSIDDTNNNDGVRREKTLLHSLACDVSLNELITAAMYRNSLDVECNADEDAQTNITNNAKNEIENESEIEIRFENVYDIKKKLIQITNKAKEFYAGRYTGILETENKSVLVYVGNGLYGMSWSNVATKTEFSAHHAYVTRCSPYRGNNILKGGENHGVMLVTNAKTFADLYEDKKKKRKKENFAEGFDSFIIIPLTKRGIDNLSDYMRENREEYENWIIEAAISSGTYEQNKTGFYSLFPLLKEDIPYSIGVFIDAIKINRIKKIVLKNQMKYGIVCLDWQVDFYKRVMPDASYKTISIQS